MKEREAEAKAKRKRDNDAEETQEEQVDGADGVDRAAKRQKSENEGDAEARRAEKVQKKKEKRQRKKDKVEKDKAKVEARKARKQQREAAEGASDEKPSGEVNQEVVENGEAEDEAIEGPDGLEKFDVSGLAETKEEPSPHSSAPTTPVLDSPAFDLATNGSAASSSSSLDPPHAADPASNTSNSKPHPPAKPTLDTASASLNSATKSKDLTSGTSSPRLQLPQINDEELQARLRARIEALRAARKADGPDGKPARSRQELLDQRRKKEEQRKATKKAQRQKAKEDEQRRREEQLRGSGSPLSRVGDVFSPQPRENNFSFSRLAFQDGSAANADLTELHDPKRKKGPQDPKTALQAAQNRDAKVAGYDNDKQANIAEKDMWFNARKRAGGERIRDDTSLLKKALKRKEKQKSKSEKDWKEREETVTKGREMKQKKREANLLKRREEKGTKGGKKKPSKKGAKGKRPGFEGRFKA